LITWDRIGDTIICTFTSSQIGWLRGAMSHYRDRLEGRRDTEGIRICSQRHSDSTEDEVSEIMGRLLVDLPIDGGVLVFRNQGHRVAWAWALVELQTMHEAERDRREDRDDRPTPALDCCPPWVHRLVDFLLDVPRIPSDHGVEPI
jgi:hypothetical protein